MNRVLFILRMVFGAIFIWSGIAKVKDPIGFAEAVRNFELVQDPVAPALALLIPWIETVGGLAVLVGKGWRGALVVLVISLFAFTGALGIAWSRGLDISCGCFGGSGDVNYPQAVWRNVGLMIWAGLLLWKLR